MNLDELAELAPAGPRILFIDLERVPGSVTLDIWHPKDFARMSYGPHPSKWDEQPRMLCFAARWDGRKRGEFHASWDVAEVVAAHLPPRPLVTREAGTGVRDGVVTRLPAEAEDRGQVREGLRRVAELRRDPVQVDVLER